MNLAVYNQKAEKKTELALPSEFDMKVSAEAVTLYINYLRAALRFPVANTKDRSEVSGGGRKPYKQKGTGNARAGSTRSPLWVGGGVTFGPHNEKNFRIRMNSKQKKQVIFGILADLIRDEKVRTIDNLTLEEIKTKNAAEIVNNFDAIGKVAVIVMPTDANTIMSFRNIAGVNIMTPSKLDVVNLMSSSLVLISKDALLKYNEFYSFRKEEIKELKPAKTVKAETVESETEEGDK